MRELFTRQQFILGPQVSGFEAEFATATGADHVVGVGNGTDAIQLALRAADINGEVLTTALTAPFTGIGILGAGCTIRFADIDPETLQIDPADAGNRLRKKTAAVVPVHLYGQPCNIAAIRKLGLPVMQDACQAHGATAGGKALTAWSPMVAYSFYPTKNLGCLGDGGAVVTNSARLAAKLRELRDGGRRGGQVTFVRGINSRLDEMHACYLRAFLLKLGEWNEDRRRTARLYDEGLRDVDGVRLIRRTDESVCHLYVIRAKRRDKLRAFLSSKGIGSGIHYPVPLHLHPTYRECGQKRGDLPVAEKASREIISLPLWPYLPESAAMEVVQAVRGFYGA
ncbi:MAG: DegT/DnrJ/EryC1/StrS family aminotransferase [Acidobacteria bacterium]|nr:DegT/DnrJ/EryC1/StrS family aminotransferase [Acidobacteriota bacterium]